MGMLDVRGLTARYSVSRGQVHAVEDVSFSLNRGESMGIAGESACGKSTLGLAVIRMLQGGKVVSGTVHLDSVDITSMSDVDFDRSIRWKEVSMIFQGAMNSLDPVFTIKEQFVEVLEQHGFEGDVDKVIFDTIGAVGLGREVLKKYPHELSGGMKQRVVISMSLVLKPKLVIADEPTTALDVLIQAQVINLFKRLKRDGMSIVMITHDLAVLSEIADRIGIMYGGQMVELGSSRDVYRDPKHPYTQGLLESIPTLRGRRPKYISGNPPDLVDPEKKCLFYDRCPKAMEKCKTEPPNFKTKSGYVKCWLYE